MKNLDKTILDLPINIFDSKPYGLCCSNCVFCQKTICFYFGSEVILTPDCFQPDFYCDKYHMSIVLYSDIYDSLSDKDKFFEDFGGYACD